MSLDKCCRSDTNAALSSHNDYRNFYSAWSKVLAVASTVCLTVLLVFVMINLVNNPNYSLIADAVTSSQKHFVYSNLVLGTFFGLASIWMYDNYRFYDDAIKECRVNRIIQGQIVQDSSGT